jgi:hypothetical protein
MGFLTEFRKANLTRCELWHLDGVYFRSVEGWFGAVAGEVGEMLAAFCDEQMQRWISQGLIEFPEDFKARDRARSQLKALRQSVLDEIADVAVYLDLLSARLGHDVGDPGERYAHEIGRDAVIPGAAASVLLIGDLLHKIERAQRDAHEVTPPAELEARLAAQINKAFAHLDAAARAMGGVLKDAAADKFNRVSKRKGLPVRLKRNGNVWTVIKGEAP